MKQLITSVFVAGVLLKVLCNTDDFMTQIVVVPFLIFAVGFGLKNALMMMNQDILAIKVSKVYVVAFLIYWFGFLTYWDYVSFMDGHYMQIFFSLPLWIGGFYFTRKRLFKKR